MSSFNRLILIGRLTGEPEVRHTQNDLTVASFSVAINRPTKKGAEQVTDFIHCTAWRQDADFIGKYFTKGSEILVEGELHQNRYKDKDGNSRSVLEVTVRHADFVGAKQTPAAPAPEMEEMPDDGELPF